jgi:diguanylate cyclase (GGDEF)-like protein
VALFGRLRQLFFGYDPRPDLIIEKTRALAGQSSLLYFVLVANIILTGIANFKTAPLFLTVVLPAIFTLIGVMRVIQWRSLDVNRLTPEQATGKLKHTIRLVGVMGITLVAWSLALVYYGGPYEQGQVAVFMALTATACMLALMQVRAAVMQLAVIIGVPFTALFLTDSHPPFIALAGNVLFAITTLIFMTMRHHKTFVELVIQRQALEQKNIETQKLSDENMRLATRDALTGLPNRRSFLQEFQSAINVARSSNEHLALLLIDLDGFKPINDLYGHAAGDSLLVKASARLRDVVGDTCIFARLGGDEFAIGVRGFKDESELSPLANRICAALSQPYRLAQAEAAVSASMGIALFGVGGQNETELFEHADYALYQAKETAIGAPVFFNEAHAHTIKLLHQVDQNLRNGTLERELTLVYQPIVHSATREVTGYEALARWRNATIGDISPLVFIPAAGKSGMADRITRTLFRRLLTDIHRLPTEARVSFNLSARDLVNPQTILGIIADIQAFGVVARRLQFEVTEPSVTAEFNKVSQSLMMLRNMGCTISLDNFGSGQSILSYVYRLPIDTLKIDASFINESASNHAAQTTLKAIVGLCDQLDLTCVAVGVETEEHAKLAHDMGCVRLQGYHISRPKPLAELVGAAVSAA